MTEHTLMAIIIALAALLLCRWMAGPRDNFPGFYHGFDGWDWTDRD